jgi:hypothetical protein
MFVVSLMTVRLRALRARGVINSVTHVPVDENETQSEIERERERQREREI